MSHQGRRVRRAAALLLALLLSPASARAFSGGIDSTVFSVTGCPLCHFGGTAPNLVLTGPTTVNPGDTVAYTLTIWGNPLQTHGGLNASAPDGILSLGGPFAGSTRTIVGLGGRTEITHLAPKQGDFTNAIEFSFLWTAPIPFSGVTITTWGNAVNANGGPSGDLASVATIVVSAPGSPTPTPTPLPTVTPIPCLDGAPADSALLSDAEQQRCQKAVAKAGLLYLRHHLKTARTCLKAFQRGDLDGDPYALCVGSATVPPSDQTTAGKLAAAEAKVRAVLSAKCDAAAVAALDLCAETESELEDCLLEAHRQRAIDAIVGQYGNPIQTNDKSIAKCQNEIAAGAGKYVSARLQAAQKCLAKRNKDGAPAAGAAALCAGALLGGLPQAPADAKAADKVSTALANLADKINACTDPQVAALGVCANTRAALIQCLTCVQTGTVFDLIGDEYGG